MPNCGWHAGFAAVQAGLLELQILKQVVPVMVWRQVKPGAHRPVLVQSAPSCPIPGQLQIVSEPFT